MGEGKRVERKEISTATTVKAIITGYVAYGVLLGFVVFMAGLILNWSINSNPSLNHRTLAYTVPLLGLFVLYFIVHLICKLSIFDVFKKCKTNPENIDRVATKLNFFILLCIVFYAVVSVGIMLVNFSLDREDIAVASYQYSNLYSSEHASQLTREMMNNYNEVKTNTLISTIILELGMSVILFSVIPLQKQLIKQYNVY